VRVEQLDDAGGSRLALWDPDEEWREAERTLDQVSARFGRGAIGPASLVGSTGRVVGETANLRAMPDD
jgi:DNA polymerase-4